MVRRTGSIPSSLLHPSFGFPTYEVGYKATATQVVFRIMPDSGHEGPEAAGSYPQQLNLGASMGRWMSWAVLAPSAASCHPHLPSHQPTPAQVRPGWPVSLPSPSMPPGDQPWGVCDHSHSRPAPHLQGELGSHTSGREGETGRCSGSPSSLRPRA